MIDCLVIIIINIMGDENVFFISKLNIVDNERHKISIFQHHLNKLLLF